MTSTRRRSRRPPLFPSLRTTASLLVLLALVPPNPSAFSPSTPSWKHPTVFPAAGWRGMSSLSSMPSSSSSALSSSVDRALPLVLAVEFVPGSVKQGGLLTYLRLLALGGQRSGDHPYQVRPSADGLNVIFSGDSGGALAIYLEDGDTPPQETPDQPVDSSSQDSLRLIVERLDPARIHPYAGEEDVALSICAGLQDLADDQSIAEESRLFQFTSDERYRMDLYLERGYVSTSPPTQGMLGSHLFWPIIDAMSDANKNVAASWRALVEALRFPPSPP